MNVPSQGDVARIIAEAVAAKGHDLADELARLERHYPTVRWREFAAGRLSPGSQEFRFGASNLGIEENPRVFALMDSRSKRIVRERASRRLEYARRRAERAHKDEHLSPGAIADSNREIATAQQRLASISMRPRTTTPPPGRSRRGAGRPAVRGAARRSSARSGDSGESGDDDESEPPRSGRLCECGCRPAHEIRVCACGCGREITHKRADARTFGASCRQKLSREASRATAANPNDQRWKRTLAIAADIAHVEQALVSGALDAGTGARLIALLTQDRLNALGVRPCRCRSGLFFRDPDGDAVCALCGCWLASVASRLGNYDALDAFVRANGTRITRRPIPKEWRTRRPEPAGAEA